MDWPWRLDTLRNHQHPVYLFWASKMRVETLNAWDARYSRTVLDSRVRAISSSVLLCGSSISLPESMPLLPTEEMVEKCPLGFFVAQVGHNPLPDNYCFRLPIVWRQSAVSLQERGRWDRCNATYKPASKLALKESYELESRDSVPMHTAHVLQKHISI